MYQYLAAWFTRLSIASAMKSPNMISMTGRSPVTALPKAAPASASSEIGVSKTRSSPNSSARPGVALKTPPAAAMSSPNSTTRSSRITCGLVVLTAAEACAESAAAATTATAATRAEAVHLVIR